MTIKAFIKNEEKKRSKDVEPPAPVAAEISSVIEQAGDVMPAAEQNETGDTEEDVGDAVSRMLKLGEGDH